MQWTVSALVGNDTDIFCLQFYERKNGDLSDFMMPEANLVSVSWTLHIFRSFNLGRL